METRNVQRLGRKRMAFIVLVLLHMTERQKEKGGGGEQKNSTTDGNQTSCCCDGFRHQEEQWAETKDEKVLETHSTIVSECNMNMPGRDQTLEMVV